MNIFEYNDKEYDKKLEEIFSNIDREQLKKGFNKLWIGDKYGY